VLWSDAVVVEAPALAGVETEAGVGKEATDA